MASRKSILDISWNVPEETYRNDPSYHYSLLSDFRNKGIHAVEELLSPTEEKKPSKSLIFGSLLDAMLTDPDKLSKFEVIGKEEDVLTLTATELKVANYILENKDIFPLDMLRGDTDVFYECFANCDAYTTLKAKTVIDKHGERILKYIESMLKSTPNKLQVTEEDWIDALECKDAIMASPMRKYFESLPFDGDVERVCQLKLKVTDPKTGITYRVMLDNVYVDHDNKTIQPNDVKTTSSYEDEFYHSFVKWNYDIQARLYWRALYTLTQHDDYFKHFSVLPFQFLVVSRYSKTPLIWRYDDCVKRGELIYRKRDGSVIILEDPYELGRALLWAAEHPHAVRDGISTIGANSIEQWIEAGI